MTACPTIGGAVERHHTRLPRPSPRRPTGCRRASTSPRTSRSCPAGPTPQVTAGPLDVHGQHRDGREPLVVLGGVDRPARRGRHASTSTASPAGPSSTRPGAGSPLDTLLAGHRDQRPTTRWCTATAATRRTCRWRPARRAGLGRLRVRRRGRCRPSTAARPGCSSRTCTSGSRAKWVTRHRPAAPGRARASGSSSATTTTATRGASSGTRGLTRRARAWRAADSWSGGTRPPPRRTLRPRRARTGRATWPGSTSTSGSPPRTATRPPAATRCAAPPTATGVEITVQRADGGEVSPFLADDLAVGDRSRCADRSAAGSSGARATRAGAAASPAAPAIVPLMAMIRARRGAPTARRSG